MKNRFIPLDDLVYAPLQALAESNQRLECQVVNSIRNMGTVTKENGKEVIHLEHLNVVYEQMSQKDGTYQVNEVEMKMPMVFGRIP